MPAPSQPPTDPAMLALLREHAIPAPDMAPSYRTLVCPTCKGWLPHPADTSTTRAGCPTCQG